MPRNIRDPAPENPVRTYPVPDITDQVLLEWVTSELASSQALNPGDPHPNSRDFPGFKLGKQEAPFKDENWFIRYWVMDQPETGDFNRDFWNYAIQFAQNDNLNPTFIRAYRTLKDGYAPLEKGSPDPLFTGTYLVSEEAKQFDPTSEFYADYFNVIRVYETLPGPFIPDTRIDVDGVVVTVNTRRNLCANITPGELPITGGVWTKTTSKGDDAQICDEVVETRTLPGNPMVRTKLDKYGNNVSEIRTMKDTTTIDTIDEIIVDGGTGHDFWVKSYKEPISDLVAWEVIETIDLTIAANNYITSADIDGDEEIVQVQKRLRKQEDVTPLAFENAGTIFENRKNEINKLVSEEEQRSRPWLDKASYSLSIPNLIPEWARPQIPTIVESHIIAGTAALPVLGPREFQRTERQLTKLLFERRVEKITDITFPVTAVNTQTTEQYGGAVLEERLTLDEATMTADTGFLVVSSETSTLAVYNGPSPPGLYMKRTLLNPGSEWPTLPSKLWDDEMQVIYDREEQIMEAPYTVAVPSVGDNFIETREEIDQWRDRRIKITKNPDATDVSTALVDVQGHPYQFAGWLDTTGFGYYVRKTRAELTEHVIRTWWIESATRPTTGATGSGADVEYDPILMDNIIISTLNSVTTLAYSGECLHDELTTFGVLLWPATTPDKTTYVGTWIGTERVITAEVKHTMIPFLWKAQTISVVMR